MLHFETIEPKTLDLLKNLQALPLFAQTRLVGGTALALQLGHRKSIDIDLFGSIEDLPEIIRDECSSNYPYAWLDECLNIDGVRLASKRDIAAMKISAIINRGTKKDFIDLYYLLKEFSLQQILQLYMTKYQDGSEFIALKSLAYFEDAEADPMPYMFEEISWEEIKSAIRIEVMNVL